MGQIVQPLEIKINDLEAALKAEKEAHDASKKRLLAFDVELIAARKREAQAVRDSQMAKAELFKANDVKDRHMSSSSLPIKTRDSREVSPKSRERITYSLWSLVRNT